MYDRTPPATEQERAERMQALWRREMVGRSPDGRVAVKVSSDGRLTQVRLLDDVLRRYDTAALGELVTRTVRSTQLRAAAAARREIDAIDGSPSAERSVPSGQ